LCSNYTAYKVGVIHIGSPLDSQIQQLSAARVAQYFTSLALGKNEMGECWYRPRCWLTD